MHKYNKNKIDESYFGSGRLLKKAIKKYGKENFKCEIIEWCKTREQLSEREKYWISKVKAPINPEYYNIEDGGFGGHNEFYTQATTEKQINALKIGSHLPASEKLKSQLSIYRKNVIVSDSTKEKLRQNQLGRKLINNNIEQKYVKHEELNKFLDNGWKLGKIK